VVVDKPRITAISDLMERMVQL